MEIIPANREHIEYISSNLSDYFEIANSHFGFAKYKTDLNLIQKNISERINEDSPNFKYYVAIEDGELLGFINILLQEEFAEILVIIGDTSEVKKALIEKAIEAFRSVGYGSVYGEAGTWDDTQNILKEYNVETVQIGYKLKV